MSISLTTLFFTRPLSTRIIKLQLQLQLHLHQQPRQPRLILIKNPLIDRWIATKRQHQPITTTTATANPLHLHHRYRQKALFPQDDLRRRILLMTPSSKRKSLEKKHAGFLSFYLFDLWSSIIRVARSVRWNKIHWRRRRRTYHAVRVPIDEWQIKTKGWRNNHRGRARQISLSLALALSPLSHRYRRTHHHLMRKTSRQRQMRRVEAQRRSRRTDKSIILEWPLSIEQRIEEGFNGWRRENDDRWIIELQLNLFSSFVSIRFNSHRLIEISERERERDGLTSINRTNPYNSNSDDQLVCWWTKSIVRWMKKILRGAERFSLETIDSLVNNSTNKFSKKITIDLKRNSVKYSSQISSRTKVIKYFSSAVKQLLVSLCKSCLQGNQSVETVIRIFAELQVGSMNQYWSTRWINLLGHCRCTKHGRWTSGRSLGNIG